MAVVKVAADRVDADNIIRITKKKPTLSNMT